MSPPWSPPDPAEQGPGGAGHDGDAESSGHDGDAESSGHDGDAESSGHDGDAESSEPDLALPELEQPLPDAVRQRVVALAAAALTSLPADEVPAVLRRVARFAPNRRARLGGPLIATQLATDTLFRQRLAAKVADDAGELGAAVAEGAAPAAAEPVEVAALAYLSRPDGWRELVAAVTDTLRVEAESALSASRVRQLEQRIVRAEHDRTVARTEADKLRDELARLREEAAGLRDDVRRLTRTGRDLEARERKAAELAATEKGRAARLAADHDAEVRRLKARLAEAETLAGAARHTAKEARAVDDSRLWLLLETISQAAGGLRRELALEPTERLPADFVADTAAERPEGAMAARARGLAADDPARLDQLLALPKAHLVVDGYNVTKRGYGEMSLEQQRSRLISGLGGMAAQTRAEVTVVFDGAERVLGLPPAPRGVRVLFSKKGETADDLIRRLVRAEPSGRPVVVISSDREVADGVRRHGAYPLGSDALLRRLGRT
jgi:predicted RNA-binding protein with PIN domain